MPIVPGPTTAALTVGSLIDRVLRDYLEPPDELWVRTALTDDVGLAATEWPVDMSLLGFEESELLGPGVLVEVDGEQAIITDVTNGTVTVRRGARGTTAAEHAAGSEVLVAPAFTRTTVFDAVAESIVGLFPPLFALYTAEQEVASDGVVTLPSNAVVVTEARLPDLLSPVSYVDLGEWSSGRALRVSPGLSGKDLWITYRSRFAYPNDEGQALAELGVREEWGRIVVVGAAAQLISARPMSLSQQEFVSSQLRVEGYPVETPMRIRDALISYQEFLLERAAAGLAQQHPYDVVLT